MARQYLKGRWYVDSVRAGSERHAFTQSGRTVADPLREFRCVDGSVIKRSFDAAQAVCVQTCLDELPSLISDGGLTTAFQDGSYTALVLKLWEVDDYYNDIIGTEPVKSLRFDAPFYESLPSVFQLEGSAAMTRCPNCGCQHAA